MANLGISSKQHASNKLTISSCPSTRSNFFSDCHPFHLRNGGTVYTKMKQRKLCFHLQYVISIANRKSNDFAESLKIIDEQNVLEVDQHLRPPT